jgi:hypothetical protein
VVYHPLLTKEQAATIEKLQAQALKCIYGFGKSYATMLEMSGLTCLEERREEAFLKFARKTSEGRFKNWFPKRPNTRSLRDQKTYIEQYARCDRLYKSPIFAMRRLLNDSENRN